MQIPLSLLDITIWLAIAGIILIITSEIISPYYGKTSILIKKQRLRNVALILGFAFILTVILQLYI
jgi:hypothetical protein